MDNTKKLWQKKLPKPKKTDNKYSRGYVVVVGGNSGMSGAAILAASAALRVGAGLVKIACPKPALTVYAKRIISVMAKVADGKSEFSNLIEDKRVDSVLIGMGNGVNKRTKDFVLTALKLGKNTVLDADALTVFAKNHAQLFKAIKASKAQVILTPHEGEFKRLFKLGKDRHKAVIDAAKQSGAVVLLKGSNTIIAAPDGKFVVNKNAPANLATAGSGDVLAGIITGLMAQKMSAFDAACAGVWLHAKAAQQFGRGLISEDLPSLIIAVLKKL